MNDNLTEIVFILDRSGSMSPLVAETISGFNSFVEEQTKLPGELKLTTILFDDRYEVLHDGVDLRKIKPLTNTEYYARGWTALLDALGKSINDVGGRLSKTAEKDRPAKVLFVVTTDGLENASKEFNADQIKTMVQHQTDRYNWQFLFLGANIDSIAIGNSYGFTYTSNYSPSEIGTRSIYNVVTSTVNTFRKTGNIEENWNKDVE